MRMKNSLKAVAAVLGEFLLAWLVTFTVNEYRRYRDEKKSLRWEEAYWRGWTDIMRRLQ